MKLCFDSIEELKAFYASLKGTRGKKGEDDGDVTIAVNNTTGQAPAPILPQTGAATFQPPQASPFPAAPQPDSVVAGLVNRINARIDGAITGGQPADTVLNWFRGQCGAEAANASLDQIKAVFLAKLAVPALENIAKLMNA